jgi:methylmalonyl-CoA/ethylmalonyl-CoA epimerase
MDARATDRDPLAGSGVTARYDHTCIAGPSMAPLLATYRDLLGGVFSHGEVLPVGAVVVTLVLGDGRIELMAPTPGSTFLDGFLAGTGGRGGVHHVMFAVDDIDEAVAALDARGVAWFGLDRSPEWSEVFVHPRDNGGLLVQLAQVGDLSSVVRTDLDGLLAASL